MLQENRYRAKQNGTTYVYDIPDMFIKMTKQLWMEHAFSRPDKNFHIPTEVIVEQVELVLNEDSLVESSRHPGQNDVNIYFPHKHILNLK